MPVSYFVFYKGEAEDPAAFIARYRDVHIPILLRWPGVERVVLHTPLEARDSRPVSGAGLAMMAEIVFHDEAALNRALQSEQRHVARLDFLKFPPFHGDIVHQALRAETFAPMQKDSSR